MLGAATYKINALGQRVAKTVGGTSTHFHYDPQGTVIAESDGQGQTNREYVWLHSTPVAVIDNNTAYFIHPDHLDTPRVVTNEANTIIWRWDSDPFGVSPPLQDPDGNGQSFVLNLRLPGQYFDSESNLHYNYYRDYDPQTGRYIQPDPIGLQGGINLYGYSKHNPLSYTDPFGLEPPKSGGPDFWWRPCNKDQEKECRKTCESQGKEYESCAVRWRSFMGVVNGQPRPQAGPVPGGLSSSCKEPQSESQSQAASCDKNCQTTWKVVRDAMTGAFILILVCVLAQ